MGRVSRWPGKKKVKKEFDLYKYFIQNGKHMSHVLIETVVMFVCPQIHASLMQNI